MLEHIQTDVGRQLNSSICPKRDVKHCSELSISYLRTHQAWERDEANAANAKQNNCEKCYYIDIFYFLEAALLGNFRVTFIRLPYYMRRLGGLRAHAANFPIHGSIRRRLGSIFRSSYNRSKQHFFVIFAGRLTFWAPSITLVWHSSMTNNGRRARTRSQRAFLASCCYNLMFVSEYR